jgi:hypothetical protein
VECKDKVVLVIIGKLQVIKKRLAQKLQLLPDHPPYNYRSHERTLYTPFISAGVNRCGPLLRSELLEKCLLITNRK